MPKASAPNAPCVEVWRVAAHERDAGQRQPLLGADDVHDALARLPAAEEGDAETPGVTVQIRHHGPDLGVGDLPRARLGGHVVVGGGQARVRPAYRAPLALETREGVGGALVQQVAVHVEQGLAAGPFRHHVTVPDLPEHRAGHQRPANFSSMPCHQSKPTRRKMSIGPSTGPRLPVGAVLLEEGERLLHRGHRGGHAAPRGRSPS